MEDIADHSSSSSSDSEDEESSTTSFRSKVYGLFGEKKPVHTLLGGGKPADVFLWKDKKLSALVFGGATTIWILFYVLDYNLLTLLSQGIVMINIAFIFFRFRSPPQIPELSITEETVLEFPYTFRIVINHVFATLRDIASGKDLKKFLSTIAGLWVLSIVGSCCDLLTLMYTITVLLFTMPLTYEKYEDQVDSFAEKALGGLEKQYAVFESKVLSKIPRRPKDRLD
ncbi:hypothetical protein RD792_009164 [Penstemon davidsonii]|uniref:Reticulon-like protein n=1 Tax=Penstemon davidsonii TaxID=160366 RepID=A0ABR0DBC6_9LAMI|nr:hypothetical protein RD792_009164 [Penstemon davidsonii]